MADQAALAASKSAKKDEFYTQYSDIEKEMYHYSDQFRNKTVFCNCDDPFESEFFMFFAMNFEALGLKRLIATCYIDSPIAGEQLSLFDDPQAEPAYKIEITGATMIRTPADVKEFVKGNVQHLVGNGDFRSHECLEFLKQSDIVVTNPPFSLFREFLAQLIAYGKQFIIIGNVNAITYKEVFPLIMDNKLWMGVSIHSGDREFRVPDHYPLQASGFRIDEQGRKYIRVKGVRWFTNMDNAQRHEFMPLYKRYSPQDFPRYDNFDAINVDVSADIPEDYDGSIGVPITFLDKYCPEQFQICGITKTWFGGASKIYPQQIQVNSDGRKSTVTKLNDGAALKLKSPPDGKTYYIVDNDYYIQLYARVIIKKASDRI